MFRDKTEILPPAKLKEMKGSFSWEKQLKSNERIPALEEYYRFQACTVKVPGANVWLTGMALSPRGRIHKKEGNASKWGFTCCFGCKAALCKKDVPFWAIVNRNYVGSPPRCLQELNEVELALLSPVHKHGYCFTWNGGKQMAMKGNLNLMRVEERRLAQAVTQLECMGLTQHVLILITGRLTDWQRRKIKDRTAVRTDKLIAAMKWLVENHRKWKGIDLDVLKEQLTNRIPVVRDISKIVQGANTNIEEEVIFQCYYPDGAVTPKAGGFEEPGAFQDYVEEMAIKGFDVEFKVDLQKKFVDTDNNDQLLSACLLQFPYGIGGMDETRLISQGKRSTKIDVTKFLSHLSRKSDPLFQLPMMQLVMYSQMSKLRLLETSRLQVKGKQDAQNLATGLQSDDLHRTIQARRHGNYYGGTHVSRRLIECVEACSKDLPHTYEAAKKQRANGESMQHHFGQASVFMTVTFDDENSFLIQVLTGKLIDDNVELVDLSDEDLKKRGVARAALRIDFPGFAAIGFEMLLDIVMEEVIAWDRKHRCPMANKGLFGNVFALSYCVEEQGRKTLHTHISIWIEGYNAVKKQLFFGEQHERVVAERVLEKFFDHIASTEMFPKQHAVLQHVFDHEGCSEASWKYRKLPVVVCDQALRELRHRHGFKQTNGNFAFCPQCPKTWSVEDMVKDLLRYNGYKSDLYKTFSDCPTLTDAESEDSDILEPPRKRLKTDKPKLDRRPKEGICRDVLHAACIQYQKPKSIESVCPIVEINAAYQHHSSCHVTGCFKCAKLGKNHKCGPLCECRYRLPDRKRKQTTVRIDQEGVQWFSWRGTEALQPLAQIVPKRATYDLFQNVYCPAVSQTKFTCNSNISLITDGPVGQYMFKYCYKDNTNDQSAEYAEVDAAIKKADGIRVHEDDRKEALRLINRAAFAHNKRNVINAPLASFLLRNDSRFYFSHVFTYCPLKDIMRLHKNRKVDSVLKVTTEGTTFLENQALHYLCRPKELEDFGVRDFYEQYAVSWTGKRSSEGPILPFIANTGFYEHPSAVTEGRQKGKCRQGVYEKKEFGFIKVSQWSFPDTANFKADILTCDVSKLNSFMETYAELVLTLFHPHRSPEDLKVAYNTIYPFTMKLREVFEEDEARVLRYNLKPIVFTPQNVQFLDNMQNTARNALRYKIKNDDLQSCTLPMPIGSGDFISDRLQKDDIEEELDVDEEGYEMFLQYLDDVEETPANDKDPTCLRECLQGFSFVHMRNKGVKESGYHRDMTIPVIGRQSAESSTFVHTENVSVPELDIDNEPPTFLNEKKKYSVDKVVQVLLRKTVRKQRNVFDDCHINVADANGSVQSIREWGRAAFRSDRKQMRAFESIIASFLLTFYDEDPDLPDIGQNDVRPQSRNITKFRLSRRALLKLKGSDKEAQMICLLHGAGGSGKSTVINLVQAYAKSYCESIGHPYTSRTIVVTAMSGVAATLLHGETTHKLLGLNRSGITSDEQDAWADTRLLIIDEISFASRKDFEKMHEHVCLLMREHFKIYGGLNIVFAGDFSQLEPVQQDTIYKDDDYVPEFHGRLNCFIELDGMHRFKDDLEWGQRLKRFREGEPTLDDIDVINDNCVVKGEQLPQGIQICSYRNRERDAINSAIFEEYCDLNKPTDGAILKTAVVIFMDDLQVRTATKTFTAIDSNKVKTHFYQYCGEDDCKKPRGSREGRVDNVLKLYEHCSMMLTENSDVSSGEANGTCVTVEQVNLKVGEHYFPLKLACGTIVQGVYASQVRSILVKHVVEDITPQTFEVKATGHNFDCDLDMADGKTSVRMKGEQFPLISNSCTTGHKLQGCTVASILVNDWFYGSNWAYVVLSRVKTMAGLYLRQPLSTDLSKYKMSDDMKSMLKRFRDTISLQPLSDDDYQQLQMDTTYDDEEQ